MFMAAVVLLQGERRELKGRVGRTGPWLGSAHTPRQRERYQRRKSFRWESDKRAQRAERVMVIVKEVRFGQKTWTDLVDCKID